MESIWILSGVHQEFTRSPSGVSGLYQEYQDFIRSPSGVHQEYQDFIRTPDGVHQDLWLSVTYRQLPSPLLEYLGYQIRSSTMRCASWFSPGVLVIASCFVHGPVVLV